MKRQRSNETVEKAEGFFDRPRTPGKSGVLVCFEERFCGKEGVFHEITLAFFFGIRYDIGKEKTESEKGSVSK